MHIREPLPSARLMNDFAAIEVLRQHDTPEQPPERAFRFGPHLRCALATFAGRNDCLALPALPEPVLLWIASGAATAELGPADGTGRSILLRQGDICLGATPQAIRLRPLADDEPRLKTLCVHIGLPMLAQAVQSIHRKPLADMALRDAAGRPDDTLASLLDLLYTMLKRPTPCAQFVQGVAQALVAHLVHRHAGIGPAALPGLPPHKLRRSLCTMRAALDEPFNLEHLAQQAELSVCHFSRSFKLATGLSPSRYFVQLRIEEAKRLLCETAHPVIDVALALGYRSPSHFAQVFRKLTGVSPTAYRAGAARPWPNAPGSRHVSPDSGAAR
jgi:AraC family transcriptional regulator